MHLEQIAHGSVWRDAVGGGKKTPPSQPVWRWLVCSKHGGMNACGLEQQAYLAVEVAHAEALQHTFDPRRDSPVRQAAVALRGVEGTDIETDAQVAAPDPLAQCCTVTKRSASAAHHGLLGEIQYVPASDKLLEFDRYAEMLAEHIGDGRRRHRPRAERCCKISLHVALAAGVVVISAPVLEAAKLGQHSAQGIDAMGVDVRLQPVFSPGFKEQADHAVRQDVEKGACTLVLRMHLMGGDALRVMKRQTAARAQQTDQRRRERDPFR